MNQIEWGNLRDRHIKGVCIEGDVWIRLDRSDKVIALYTIFEETEKHLPLDEHEEDPEFMKLRAEEVLSNYRFAKELAANEKTVKKCRV